MKKNKSLHLTAPLLLLAGSAAAQQQIAELRVYDPATHGNVSVSSSVVPPAASQQPAALPAPQTTAPPSVKPVQVARPAVPAASATPSGLGSAMVFIKSADFSSVIASEVKQISQIPNFQVVFYIQNASPRQLAAQIDGPLKDLPDGIQFSVDIDGGAAHAQSAENQNVIVYRDPSGAVRHYNLVSEYNSFMNQIGRLRGV